MIPRTTSHGQRATLLAVCFLLLSTTAFAQREHVPVNMPVYDFLKTMEVRGLIREYHHAILPLSRSDVAQFLAVIDSHRVQLSSVENEYLDDYLIDFQVELGRTSPAPNSFFKFDLPLGDNIVDAFAWKRKSLYEYHDSNATLFVDGLASADVKFRRGDTSQHVTLLQLGGRVRGTVGNAFGYSIVATNGSLNSGDLSLALQDPRLRSNFKLADAEHKNFDFTEGYFVYDSKWISLEVGRESMQIGTGYLDRLVLMDHAPPMDMIKLSIQYKSLRYIFLHGSLVHFRFDDSTRVRSLNELVPKYMALHRVEFDLLGRVRFGVSEMAIYGNQFAQLAYLNPFSFLKAVENSQQSIDNTLMGFDVEVHAVDNLSAFAEIMIDDFSTDTRGEGARNNKIGYHAGAYWSDPVGVRNVNVVLEYTRLDPYVYSHRTDWNFYTNRNISLGPDMQPNSDRLTLQAQWRPRHNLGLVGSVAFLRHGESAYDQWGTLLPDGNVGGNVLDGERNANDPSGFLHGTVTSSMIFSGRLNYEPFKQWTVALSGDLVHRVTGGVTGNDVYLGMHLAVDY